MGSYGQFCPVAKAMELLDERWTVLVVRELLQGSRHFNELRRGVPRMSPALLSTRLRSLARAGVVERYQDGGRTGYRLTPAGEELREAVEALGRWATRWLPDLGDADLDPHLLMWDIHRGVDRDAVPPGRTVLRFTFPDLPAAVRDWWLVIDDDEVDVCDHDPGHPVAACVRGELRAVTRVWLGDVPWSRAVRSGELEVIGPSGARREVPRWLKLSPFAGVPRPLGDEPARVP